MKYLMTDRYTRTNTSGTYTERKPDKEVDEEYVKNFVDAIDFFEDIGGSETIRRRQGRVFVTSISPDRKTTRETIFTPIKDGPSLPPMTATGDAHDTPHYQSRGNNL